MLIADALQNVPLLAILYFSLVLAGEYVHLVKVGEAKSQKRHCVMFS